MPYYVAADGTLLAGKPPDPWYMLPYRFVATIFSLLALFFSTCIPASRGNNPGLIKRPPRPSGFFSAGGGGSGGGGGGGGGGAPRPEPSNIKGFDNSVGSSTACAPGGG